MHVRSALRPLSSILDLTVSAWRRMCTYVCVCVCGRVRAARSSSSSYGSIEWALSNIHRSVAYEAIFLQNHSIKIVNVKCFMGPLQGSRLTCTKAWSGTAGRSKNVACDALYVMPRSLQGLKYGQKIQLGLTGQRILSYVPYFPLSSCDSFSICSDIVFSHKRFRKWLLQKSGPLFLNSQVGL